MKEKIRTYIKKEISIGDIDEVEITDDLLGSGILDSMGIMKLIDFIEKERNIPIPEEDMTVENFMTIERMLAYLEKK